MDIINQDWVDSEGNPDGGTSIATGVTIAWQRGSLEKNGRNGAFLIEVLRICAYQLQKHQSSKFACEENQLALKYILDAIEVLELRRDRREREGKLGTHKPD